MRSPAIIRVTVTIHVDKDKEGEGGNEHLQEHRARTNLGHGYGNNSWPAVADLWTGSDLCRVGMPDPSVNLQPNYSLLDTRSSAPLNATSPTQASAPTLATLRRLTIRATPLSLRSVESRIPARSKGLGGK
jgi:hypothetical protein